MADQYIDETFVEAHFGKDVVDAIQAFTGIDLTVKIEGATALIQAYLRNNGYTVPTTTTDEAVKLATMGALWAMLAATPEANLDLPDQWASHPLNVAFLGILDGSATLDLPLSNIAAKGGMSFSESSESITVQNGSRPQRSARKNLIGY